MFALFHAALGALGGVLAGYFLLHRSHQPLNPEP